MTERIFNEPIDYDKMIEDELSCINEVDLVEEKVILVQENSNIDIPETNSMEIILDKISKLHEGFYKRCFENLMEDEQVDEFEIESSTNDHQARKILNSHNLCYDKFIENVSNTQVDLENKCNKNKDSNQDFQSNQSFSQVIVNPEELQQKLNDENFQAPIDIYLKELEDTLKSEEKETKVRLLRIENEIEAERQILMKLKTESEDLLNFKRNWAAITIQKNFRRFRIRKRIGSQIDDAINMAKRKLFNKKFIIREKEAQKLKAAEIRKAKKLRQLKPKKTNNDLDVDNSNIKEVEEIDEMMQENMVGIDDTKMNINIEKKIKTYDSNTGIDRTLNSENKEEFSLEEEGSKNDTKSFQDNSSKDYFEIIEENLNVVTEFCEPCIEKMSEVECDNVPELMDITVSKFSELVNIQDTEIIDFKNEVDDDKSSEDKSGNHSNELLFPNTDLQIKKIDDNYNSKSYDRETTCIIENIVNKEEALNNSEDLIKNEAIDNFSIEINNMIECVSVIDKDDLQTEMKVSDHHQLICDNEQIRCLERDDNSQNEKENIMDINKRIISQNNYNVLTIEIRKSECFEFETEAKIESVNFADEKENQNIEKQTIVIISPRVENQLISNISVNNEVHGSEECNIIDGDVNQLSSETDDNQTTIFVIEEKFLRTLFPNNDRILMACINWMKKNVETNERMHSSHPPSQQSDENVVHTIPRYLLDDCSLKNCFTSIPSHSVIMEPTTGSKCSSLAINDHELTSINDLKDEFPSLNYLILNRNSLKYFHSYSVPDSVRYLNINENKLEWAYFGNKIESCLTILFCSSNELTELSPNCFKNCHNLIHVDFSSNNFTTIDSIFRGNDALTSLCSINLNNNILTNLVNLEYYCPNLTHLSISGNHIKSLSEATKFPLLVDLDLSKNSLQSLPSLENFPLLVRLNIAYNDITDLNLFIDSWLPCLSNLILDSNKLKDIPEFVFPTLQTLSIQRNFLQGSMNCSGLFANCPLLTLVNLNNNLGPVSPKSRGSDHHNIVKENEILRSENYIPCPDGEFQSKCFDFSDRFQQKTDKFVSFLSTLSNVEFMYKHQYHYYRCIREIAEEFSKWMYNFLFQLQQNQTIEREIKFNDIHVHSAVKIQSLWRGYRTRKWYYAIISHFKSDTEKYLEDFKSIDLSELDETQLLNNLDDDFKSVVCPPPNAAWTASLKKSEENRILSTKSNKSCDDSDGEEFIMPTSETTYRSNSVTLLSKKGQDIMKEWGFENPNSALWMMERAKKFQRKYNKNQKVNGSSSIKQRMISSDYLSQMTFNQNPSQEESTSKLQSHRKLCPAPINTVKIQPPNFSQGLNYRSKIDDWLNESHFMPNTYPVPNPDRKPFLPLIEADNSLKKFYLNSNRAKSSNTRLPSINYVP